MQLRRLAALMMFCACSLLAQQTASTTQPRFLNCEGTDFWLCFMKNFRDVNPERPELKEPAVLQVFITADSDADVTLEIPALGFRHQLRVAANSIGTVRITPTAELDTSAQPQPRALHIRSTAPISVYALNHRFQTTDTYLAFPTHVLGTEYRAMCYTKLSSELTPLVAIVAPYSDTRVEIIPTTPTTDGHDAGERYTITLDSGQVYQVRALYSTRGSGDLTGTIIRANKPIAVFSGHTCAYVPPGVVACNHLVEQLPPLTSWGKHYYVGKLKKRSRYTYRVLAAENGTRVFRNQTLIAVLNAGEYYEDLNETEHIQITADKPILVAQYSQGYRNGDDIGDPMMILISPTQQFVTRYRIATPIQGSWEHYLNIVTPEEGITSLRLDGRPLRRELFEQIGISRYYIAQVRLDYGTHTLSSEYPFGLYSYGFGYDIDAYDAYGTMGGQTFLVLDTLADRLPPEATARSSSDGRALQLIVRDDRPNDRGLESITVQGAENLRAYLPRIERGQPQASFAIYPLDPRQSGFITLAFTDAAGNRSEATYSYCYNAQHQRFEFIEGNKCPEQRPWQIGLHGIAMALYHSATFQSTASLQLERPVGNVYGASGSIGFSLTRQLTERLRLAGRLSIEPYGQLLSSPDTATSAIRRSGDSLSTLQAETLLTPSLPAVALGVGAEWRLLSVQRSGRTYELYATAGMRVALQLSSRVELQRQVALPMTAHAAPLLQSGRTIELPSLRTLRPELFGGFGITAPLPRAPRWTAVMEVHYIYPLTSILSDADWRIERLQWLLGVRYSF